MKIVHSAKLYTLSGILVAMLATAGMALASPRAAVPAAECGGAACDIPPHSCGPYCFCEDVASCHLNVK